MGSVRCVEFVQTARKRTHLDRTVGCVRPIQWTYIHKIIPACRSASVGNFILTTPNIRRHPLDSPCLLRHQLSRCFPNRWYLHACEEQGCCHSGAFLSSLILCVIQLVYPNCSSVCIINRDYASPANFLQVFDISKQSLTSAQLVVDEPPWNPKFTPNRLIGQHFDHMNQAVYGDFNPQILNKSFSTINSTINNGNDPTGPGYISATLQGYGAQDDSIAEFHTFEQY